MKNPNISEYKGNVEIALKNGDFGQILMLNGVSAEFIKSIPSVEDAKIVEKTDDFPYSYSLLKFRSPFRIGTQQLKVFKIDEIASRDKFDEENFKNLIIAFCKKFKNSLTLLPINGSLTVHGPKIEAILNKNVFGAKFVIVR